MRRGRLRRRLRRKAEALGALASALVHAVRGRDQEGAVRLDEALRLAGMDGELEPRWCRPVVKLGYVDVQAGRWPSARMNWLNQGDAKPAEGNEEVCAVLAVRGMALSDRARYGAALALLNRSVARAERCGRRRQAAWSLSLIGRVHLLRGDLHLALPPLEESLALVAAERWTAFQPWPEVLRAEAAMLMGDPDHATQLLDHAFRLACQLGDPCWEAMGARLAGLLAAETGAPAEARRHLADARERATRVSDSYQWVHGRVLDSAAGLAVEAGDPDATQAVDRLAQLAERCGLREFVVRATRLSRAPGRLQAQWTRPVCWRPRSTTPRSRRWWDAPCRPELTRRLTRPRRWLVVSTNEEDPKCRTSTAG